MGGVTVSRNLYEGSVSVAQGLKQHCPAGWRWEIGPLGTNQVYLKAIDGGQFAKQRIQYISSSHQISVLFL